MFNSFSGNSSGNVIRFELHLEYGADHHYVPGDRVKGSCLVEVKDTALPVDEFELHLIGEEHVSWSQNANRHSYSESNTFLDKTIDIKASYESKNLDSIEVGVFEYPFNLLLPLDGLRNSFRGSFGYIVYELAAKIKEPLFGHQYHSTKNINVVVPLEQDKALLAPVLNSNSKTLCCFCCSSGPLMIEGRIERSCYAPSDKICLTATFGNYSKRSVNPVVELIQEIKYNTEDYTKEEEIVRTLFKGSEIKSGHSMELVNASIAIPTQLNFSEEESKLIKNSYSLNVGMNIPGGLNLSTIFPLVIGLPQQHYPSQQDDNVLMGPQCLSNNNNNRLLFVEPPPYPNPPPYDKGMMEANSFTKF